MNKQTLYIYAGQKFTEIELIDFADSMAKYDQADNEAEPITTIIEALMYLNLD